MPVPHAKTSLAAPTDAAAAWAQIETAVRESSVMRCEDRAEEAAAMLQERLPALIRAWSENCGRSPEECREILRELFAKAQAQVAEALFTRRLVLASIRAQPKEDPVDGRLHLRRRIPVDDIVGMIDALREADAPAATARARKNFTSTRTRSLAAGAAA